MKRNTRIIQISGFKGVLLLIFMASCFVAGFAIFPAVVSMYLWNFIAFKTSVIPVINFWQGLLLWAGIGISIYLLNERNHYLFSITPKRQLTEKEVRKLITRIRMQRTQALNPMVLKSETKDIPDESEKKENV